MIVLDTTVLVYAMGADHALRDPARRLIAAVSERELEATTTVEAIEEFVLVRARRRGRSDAAALGNDYADLLSPLLTVTAADLTRGLLMFEHSEHLGGFDAVLAAAAIGAGAQALVSADGAFSGVAALRHVVPNEQGVAALLAG